MCPCCSALKCMCVGVQLRIPVYLTSMLTHTWPHSTSVTGPMGSNIRAQPTSTLAYWQQIAGLQFDLIWITTLDIKNIIISHIDLKQIWRWCLAPKLYERKNKNLCFWLLQGRCCHVLCQMSSSSNLSQCFPAALNQSPAAAPVNWLPLQSPKMTPRCCCFFSTRAAAAELCSSSLWPAFASEKIERCLENLFSRTKDEDQAAAAARCRHTFAAAGQVLSRGLPADIRHLRVGMIRCVRWLGLQRITRRPSDLIVLRLVDLCLQVNIWCIRSKTLRAEALGSRSNIYLT